MVARLAEAKGEQVAGGLGRCSSPTVVLAADTAVVLGDTVLGKPADDAEAAEMLRTLSGMKHFVFTGLHLVRADDNRRAGAVESTRVGFRKLDERFIRWYVSTGEPRDKAGAYGIQDRGVLLTTEIVGSWTNVVGLPLERLPGLFREIGLDLTG